jgi:hypothetical protein
MSGARASRKWYLINYLAAKTNRIPDQREVKRMYRFKVADLEQYVRSEIREYEQVRGE